MRLSVRTAPWRSQVAQTANSVAGLVPVVKGNGYGFGRTRLAEIAAEFCDTVAVGTVHELGGLPPSLNPVVLTPTLTPPTSIAPILTVGRPEHIEVLAGWRGRVIVKLLTDLHRYGGDVGLVDRARAAGLDVVGVGIHPPLAGSPEDRVRQITEVLPGIEPAIPVWVSHIDVERYARLPATHEYRLRLGTALWHGDKSALHLEADVLDLRPMRAGQRAGYRLGEVSADGHLVMVGAGTANGVTPLPDGRSPFHFARHRLVLHEPPHMHTSMAFVSAGDPLPEIGQWVDVQRPLHMTTVDEYRWL